MSVGKPAGHPSIHLALKATNKAAVSFFLVLYFNSHLSKQKKVKFCGVGCKCVFSWTWNRSVWNECSHLSWCKHLLIQCDGFRVKSFTSVAPCCNKLDVKLRIFGTSLHVCYTCICESRFNNISTNSPSAGARFFVHGELGKAVLGN